MVGKLGSALTELANTEERKEREERRRHSAFPHDAAGEGGKSESPTLERMLRRNSTDASNIMLRRANLLTVPGLASLGPPADSAGSGPEEARPRRRSRRRKSQLEQEQGAIFGSPEVADTNEGDYGYIFQTASDEEEGGDFLEPLGIFLDLIFSDAGSGRGGNLLFARTGCKINRK